MSAIDRIVADNDPRNGSTAVRIVRMLEEPNRTPNTEGLYPARCPACRGTGGGKYNDCPTCDGNGVV